MDVAIQAEGLRKRFGDTQALDGVDLVARAAPCSACSVPTAPARRPPCGSRDAAAARRRHRASAASTSSRQPEAVRQTIGLTGQYASVDETLRGAQNLVMIGQLLDLPRREARARAKELLAWFGLADAVTYESIIPNLDALRELQAAAAGVLARRACSRTSTRATSG